MERGASFLVALTVTVLFLLLLLLLGPYRVVQVRNDGTGDFRTVTDAVNSIPPGNKERLIVHIPMGVYHEKITIDRSKQLVSLIGETSGSHMTTITYDATALHSGTVNSATVSVDSDYFTAANIAFVNSAPRPNEHSVGAQAVALMVSADHASFFNCRFIGYQDTLCDDRGNHYFVDCYIRGTYDFIFGNAKSIYLRSTIESVATTGLSVITAQGRERVTEDTGFTFLHCSIIGTGKGNTYLGRAWKKSPRVVFAFNYMGPAINSQGWLNDPNDSDKYAILSIYYGEFWNRGPGGIPYGRVKFLKMMSYEQLLPFLTSPPPFPDL
ncbi:hypothetical protein Fmac_013266 [Flemingia macrophylla]|uniref:pectinesterase n=1 Tax=Flemingia macrophylla TaxID=520843 RepID=A0ABD1MSN9_9FABA